MNHSNSGLAHGTSGSPQLTLENGEMAAKASENEKHVQDKHEYLKHELPKTSPIPIPDNATIKVQHKERGYDQVKYEWQDGEYKYTSRWHMHTPGAPDYSQETWVVERKLPGIGYGKYHRDSVEEVMIGKNEWISKKEWKRAIAARKNGTATKQQKELLDNGHWKA